VKTIGKHDAVFLILLYALVVLVLSIIDFFANSYWAALGAIFFIHALIIFPGLMENKYGVAYVTSILLILGMIALQCFLMSYTPNPYPREKDANMKLEGNQLI
jgi:carbon starvation protein CstA